MTKQKTYGKVYRLWQFLLFFERIMLSFSNAADEASRELW